jgi:MOSC domain-containing protein YiiM
MARVVAVNVGRATPIDLGNRTIQTGIHKRGADGPVQVGRLGLTGDAVLDTEHHGGPDQAVYGYRSEDSAWWSETLGRPIPPGLFGENLVFEGLPEDLRIGDRLVLPQVTLEVTGPRIPCSTLAAAMGDAGFVKRFKDAERPGFYARVLREGPVSAGESVTVQRAGSGNVGLVELYRLWYVRPHDADAIRHALKAPLAARTRATLEERLSEAG